MDNETQDQLPRLLMIDDSPVVRKAVSKLLSKEFDIVEAEDGVIGWQKIQQDTDIQIVMTDINMPNMDGYGVLEHVRTCQDEGIRNLPVIVLTSAEDGDSVKEAALDKGATNFLTKPFTSANLKASVRAHANYHRITKELKKNTNIDELTGLPNEKGFADQLEKDVSMVNRHIRDMAVFKVRLGSTNELFNRFGRAGSDRIIKLIATTLTKAVRKEDTVGREGLSTFSISLPTAKPQGAVKMAERICEVITNNTFTIHGESVQLSLSIGVCTIDAGVKITSEQIMQHADDALEEAIKLGRGKVSTHYLRNHKTATEPPLSIDHFLKQLETGQIGVVKSQLETMLKRLGPAFALLDKEQKLNIARGVYEPGYQSKTKTTAPTRDSDDTPTVTNSAAVKNTQPEKKTPLNPDATIERPALKNITGHKQKPMSALEKNIAKAKAKAAQQ